MSHTTRLYYKKAAEENAKREAKEDEERLNNICLNILPALSSLTLNDLKQVDRKYLLFVFEKSANNLLSDLKKESQSKGDLCK